jgi:hypothetical protein
MNQLYQESVDFFMAFGPDMKGWVDAYNRARAEVQKMDKVILEGGKNVQNLMKAKTGVVDSFPHMVELVVQVWDGYKGAFDALVVAGSLREKGIISLAMTSHENIKAKIKTIIDGWSNRVSDKLMLTVKIIQMVMRNVINSNMVIQSNHRESLNKLRSIIGEVVDAYTFQFSELKKRMKGETTIAKRSKNDVSHSWEFVRLIADVRVNAYNLQIVIHLAKDIAQLIVKATKTEMLGTAQKRELAVKEKEAADYALKATEAGAELQSMIAMEQEWIVSTLYNIQTTISAVESLFQTDANHMVTVTQQRVSQESLRSLLEVACQMMDFQSQVARDAKQKIETSYWTSDTFRQAFTQQQLITQVDAHRRVIQTAEHVIRITRFLAKVDKTVDLARKIKEVEPRLVQARDEMKRLTNMEDEIIGIKISTIIENRIGNDPSTSTISFLPIGVASTISFPTKPATSFVAPPSTATSTVPNTMIAFPVFSLIGAMTHPTLLLGLINQQIQSLNRTLNEYGQQLSLNRKDSFEVGFLDIKAIKNQTGPGKERTFAMSGDIDQRIKDINRNIETINRTLVKDKQRLTSMRKEGSDTFSLEIIALAQKLTTSTGPMFMSPCQSSNPPMTATVSASSPRVIVPTITAPIQVNTEQKTDTWEEEEKQMAAVLIGLLNETPPRVTVPPPTEVSLEQPGMDKKQKKRKRDS